MTERLAAATDAAPGRVTAFAVGETHLAVANVDGAYSCFRDACTHRGCPLSDTTLDGVSVRCSCHGSRFDVTTGAVLQGPAQVPLHLLPITVVDGWLEVELSGGDGGTPAGA